MFVSLSNKISSVSISGKSLLRSFDPSKYGDLFIYLNSDDGITTVSDRVSMWEDLSGQNNNLSATESLRPLYINNWRNGHGSVLGESGRHLVCESFSGGLIDSSMTWYLAGDWCSNNNSASQFWLDGSSQNARKSIYQMVNNGNGYPALYAGGTQLRINTLAPYNTPCIVRAVFRNVDGARSTNLRVEPHGLSVLEEELGDAGNHGLNGIRLMSDALSNRQWVDGSTAMVIGYIGDIPTDNPSADIEIRKKLSNIYNIVSSSS